MNATIQDAVKEALRWAVAHRGMEALRRQSVLRTIGALEFSNPPSQGIPMKLIMKRLAGSFVFFFFSALPQVGEYRYCLMIDRQRSQRPRSLAERNQF